MEIIRQSELPPGTAYFEAGRLRSIATGNTELKFIVMFDPNDGLYATPYTRDLWRKNPCKHPHALLFDLLYEKLQSLEVSLWICKILNDG